jgi:hypothetical protein
MLVFVKLLLTLLLAEEYVDTGELANRLDEAALDDKLEELKPPNTLLFNVFMLRESTNEPPRDILFMLETLHIKLIKVKNYS